MGELAAVVCPLAFGRTAQDPFVPSTVRTRARAAWKAAGLEPITLHECRHTFASLMIAAGENPKAIQTFMGHATIQMTFDRYGHLMTTRLVAGSMVHWSAISRGGSRVATESHEEVVLMYARIARFEGGDTSQMEAVIDGAREMMDSNFDSPPEGLEGAKAVWMLVDRENARGLGVTLFENEEDLRRGDEALNAMSPALDAGQRRSSVEIYEVLHRRER